MDWFKVHYQWLKHSICKIKTVTGKAVKIVEELIEYKIQILGIAEVKKKENGIRKAVKAIRCMTEN